MKFFEFSKSLNNEIKSLYNAKGDDSFLIKQAILNLKSKLIKDFEEFNYQKIDAEKTKIEEIDAVLSTLPIGNDYRFVVLTNPNAETVKYINKFNFEDSALVVLCINAEKLNNAIEVDCNSLDKDEIKRYILNPLSKSSISIQEQALDYLIEACNGKMEKVTNELQKVISYAIDSKQIDMDVVTNLVVDSTEYIIYMLTNAIDLKDFAKYEKVLHEMSKALSKNEIFSYLGKHFKRMQYLCLNKNDAEISQILGLKPYAIKISRQNIAKNGIKYYINLYQKYVELDYKIKSGKISASNALYELVF